MLEGLEERALLDFAASSFGNVSVTRLVRATSNSAWQLADFGRLDHLDRHGVEPTHHAAQIDAQPH